MTLRVWPGEEAMEERLAHELASGQACRLGERDVTWAALVKALRPEPAAGLDTAAARLALRHAAHGLSPVAGTRGFLRALARFVAEAQRAGLSPAQVQRAAADAGDPKLVLLATAYARFVDCAVRSGARPAPAGPLGDGPVAIQLRLGWEPADVELVLGLSRTRPVALRLPWGADRPAVFAGMEPILRAFEARGDDPACDLTVVAADPAETGVAAALYRGGAQAEAGAGARVEILQAPTPQAELRAVAAHARRLVDQGVAPEDIGVATRAPGTVSRKLAEELERVGLLLDDRRGPPLAAAPPARLALAVVELHAQGFAREDVLALLASRYVAPRPGAPASHEIARRARELGLRELAPGGAGVARLPPAMAQAVRAVLAPFGAQPETAPLAAHVAWLQRTLVELGVLERARAFDAGADEPLQRVIARDQAAADALDALLQRLPRAAAEVGFGRSLGRLELAALLADLMAEVPLRRRGARGGAVRLVHLQDLAERELAHVLLVGLVDGGAPAPAQDDGIYGERERRAFNQALGRRALPSFARDADAPLPTERTPFELLLLVHAVGAARDGVLLSYAISDGARAVARSPFVDEVVRAAPWVPITRLPLGPIPELGRARAAADALARVALEAWADPAGRLPPGAALADAPALAAAVAQAVPERFARVVEVAEIERARWRFFAGAEPAGPFVGAVGAAAAVRSRAGTSAEAPVPARQLERLATCPFTFLAGRVLGVELAEEAEDAPSARNVGLVMHRCLEGLYRRRAQAGALPLRGSEEDRRALAAACEDVFAAIEAQGHPGHAVLWQLGKERIVDDLWAWVLREARGLPWGGVPEAFELAFGLPGRRGLPAVVFGDGDDAVHVGGRIDRVDRLPDGSAVVIDYKLGGREGLRDKLKPEAIAGKDLQLPLYVAAAARGLAPRAQGAFVSLKDAEPTKLLPDGLDSALSERVVALGRQVRSGELVVRPVEKGCKGCGYRTVCRVVALAEGEEDAA